MTTPPSPPVEISPALARSLIEGQFPALAPARVELLGVGWDNTAFRVNDAYVFRFPRREIAVPLLAKEACLLPWIALRLPLSVPCPAFLGEPCASYSWPFLGTILVSGSAASSTALADAARAACATGLGEFVASLHSLQPSESMSSAIGHDTLARLDIARRSPNARDRLERLAALGLVADLSPLLTILDAAPLDDSPRTDVLVHGDLYALHFMFDQAEALTGVIDWGDAHLGDPAVDLMVAHAFLPPASRGEFQRSYGPIDACTWQMARLRAVWHSATVLEYAHRISDTGLIREGQRALARIGTD